MSHQERPHRLIEHVLNLLNLLRRSNIEINRFMDSGGDFAGLEPPDVQGAQMAYEIMRFMDEMPGGVLIYYAGGREDIIYANRELLHIFQCRNLQEFRELTGNSFRGMVHPEDLEAVERSIWEQVSASQYDLDYVEYRIIRRDGEIRWIEDYGHFIHSEAVGDLFYVFLGDATEKLARRQTELDLLLSQRKAREQQLQSVIEEYDKERSLINQEYLRRLKVIEGLSINYESIFYVDLEKDQILPYRLSSRTEHAFEKRFQPRRFSLYMADYIQTWVCPEDRETMAAELTRQSIRERLAGKTTYYINYRALSGGELQYLQLRVVDAGHTGPAGQVVIGCRRVDEEIQHEMEQKQMLAEALSDASTAIAAKNAFLSNISHDMRTPLNAIFGFSSLVRKKAGDPEAIHHYAEKLETASLQLLEMIDKVLELSWNGSGDPQTAESICDLRTLMEDIHAGFLPKAAEKDLSFSLDCGSLTQSIVFCDQEKLRQLLMYLVNNAITYTNTGGSISLTAAQRSAAGEHGALYHFIVEDSGIGIDPEFIGHIFEPFSRAQNTTHSGVHGVGLGLTIAKNIVDMLGGSIDVRSTPGRGTAFTVALRLPFRNAGPETAPVSAVPLSGKRVLVAEDNPINLEIEIELLQDLGFEVESARNGKDAVEQLRQAPPGHYDLVLMDIQMPVMDGWKAAEAIRALPDPLRAQVPVIALSANAFESDIRKSLSHGMDAHLTKPLDIPQLLKTVQRVLRERRT